MHSHLTRIARSTGSLASSGMPAETGEAESLNRMDGCDSKPLYTITRMAELLFRARLKKWRRERDSAFARRLPCLLPQAPRSRFRARPCAPLPRSARRSNAFESYWRAIEKMAEREGFEPSIHFCIYDFQSYPFGLSGISPLLACGIIKIWRRGRDLNPRCRFRHS